MAASTTVAEGYRRARRERLRANAVHHHERVLNGHKWIVVPGVHGYWLGTYEPELRDAVARAVAPYSVFFDVGAHAGYYSLLASRLVGVTGRVVAFEPDPRTIDRLRRHLQLNDAANVSVVEAAVADVAGAAKFAPDASGFGGALSPTGTAMVQTVTIDAMVDIGALPAPHFLRIDAEGAEFRVICGARKTLRTVRPTVFLDTHNPAVERRCLDAFKCLRYTARPIAHAAWLCTPPPVRLEAGIDPD